MERAAAILDGLTPQQCAAATQMGAVLVLAGAGTGKTKTLTRAVANRIETHGIPAARILAVTFTNKAAREMSDRIRATLGDQAPPHWTGTFHGLGARQLRTEPEVASLRPGFDILDADDSRRIVKRVMKGMNLASGDEGMTIGRDPLKIMVNRLSKFKDSLITPDEAPAQIEAMIAQARHSDTPIDPEGLRASGKVYAEYQRVTISHCEFRRGYAAPSSFLADIPDRNRVTGWLRGPSRAPDRLTPIFDDRLDAAELLRRF